MKIIKHSVQRHNYSCTFLLFFLGVHFGISGQNISNLVYDETNANEHYGWDLASSSRWLAVAVPHAKTDMGEDAGKVIIYQNINQEWEFFQEITDAKGGVFQNFGFSIDLTDELLVVGAIGSFQNGPFSGKALVYEFDGSMWQEVSTLIASDSHQLANFGHSVAINGEVIAIGALKGNGKQINTGSVYIFNKSGDSWSEVQKLSAFDGIANDDFGFAIVVTAAKSIVIGAPNNRGLTESTGAVYVYEKQGNVWSLSQKIITVLEGSHLFFGSSLATTGSHLLIGAYNADGKVENSGAVYHYKNIENKWEKHQKLVAPNGNRNDHYGIALDISNNILIIGAPKVDFSGFPDAGLAYYYERNGEEWELSKVLEEPKPTAHNFFASSVAVHNDAISIGTTLNDFNAKDGGLVYTSSPGKILSADPFSYDGKIELINYPNPTTDKMVIRYKLLSQSNVSIVIYDNTGKLVRKLLIPTTQNAGTKEVTWNLTTKSGTKVSPGIYHYQLQMNDHFISRKIIID